MDMIAAQWARRIAGIMLILLMSGCSWWPWWPPVVVIDTDQTFDDSELEAGVTKKLTIRSDEPPCTEERTESAELNILLNLGEDYNYGRNAFSTSVKLQVIGYDSYISGGDEKFDSGELTLAINEQIPEKLRIFTIFTYDPYDEMTTDHQIKRFEISIVNYDRHERVAGDINLEVFYTEELAVEAKHPTEPDQPIVFVEPILSPTNPQTFRWQTECPKIPNYQFQLLRLHNKDPDRTIDNDIIAEVDWGRALTLEIGSSETSLTLTVAEGSGFYIWRIRPVGNFYKDGIANDDNWGVWSDAPISGDIPLNTSTPLPLYAFFYNQFDDNKNWIYTRTFTEDSKIAEQITYADGLLHAKQCQKRLQSDDFVLVSQTVYDYSGRSALSSLPAPITSNALSYIDRFLQHDGELYSPAHFDADERYRNPASISAGPLYDYYSDLNTDLTIPSAQGYPFRQTLYYGDGTDRVKEQSDAGETHRIKPDLAESRTVRKYHSGVSDDELIRIFGDEAPSDTFVSKVITIDANKTSRVTYINASGDTVATCLSLSEGNADLLDSLPSRADAASDIIEDIEGDTPCGTGCLESSKTIVFTEETGITLDYTITPNDVDESCLGSCQSCDYEVHFTIQRLDEPDPNFPIIEEPLIIEPGDCSGETYTWSRCYTLPPGSYQISRRIQGHTRSETSGNKYLDDRIDILKSELKSDISSVVEPIYEFLDDGNLEELYVSLEAQEGDESVTIDAGCCKIDIPIIHCEDLTCPEDMDFESFFEEYWADEPDYIGTNPMGNLKYLPGYPPGKFNELIGNMVSDPIDAYDCEKLWQCWVALTVGYRDALELTDSAPVSDFEYAPLPALGYNLLDNFLQCAGLKLRGTSSRRFGEFFENPGYLSHAYAYVRCNPNHIIFVPWPPWFMLNPDRECWHILSESWLVPPDCDSEEYPQEKLNDYYLCITSGVGVYPGSTVEDFVNNIMDECHEICEARRPGFELSLEELYIDNDYTRDADVGFIKDDDIVTWDCFYGQVQKLVDECKAGCGLTISTNPDNPDEIVEAGTEEEIQDMTQSMTYTHSLALPEGGSCPPEYTLLSGSLYVEDFLVSYLNEKLNEFLENLTEPTGYFDMSDLLMLEEGVCEFILDCFDDPILLVRDQEARFIIDDQCRLLIQRKEINPFSGEPYWESEEICENVCGCQISCPDVCFKWEKPEISHEFEFTALSCEDETAGYIKGLIQEQVAACVDQKIADLKATYESQCLDPDNINDRFTISYSQGYYHYTLFYYDRAGNLVRTVPPKGVDLSSTSRSDHPNHTYVTEYEYNSLGQKVKQETPDAGEIAHYYDKLGQPRFSQNDKQRGEGTYSYSKHDYLGRIAETGQSSENIASFFEHVNEQDFPNSLTDKIEVIKTVYSEPSPMIGGTQSFLQSRISYTETDDGAATHYSYDSLGNVEWLAQTVPGLGTKYVNYEYDLISGNIRQIKYDVDDPDDADALAQFYHRYTYDDDNRLIQVETSRDGRIWDRDARYEYYAHGPLKRKIIGEDQVQGVDYAYAIQGWLKGINHPSLDPAKDPGGDGREASITGKDAFGMSLGYYNGDFIKDGSPLSSDMLLNPSHFIPENGLYDGNITAWTGHIAANPDESALQYETLTGYQFRYDELSRLKTAVFNHYSDSENVWQTIEEYQTGYTYDANGNIETLKRNGCEAAYLAMDDLAYHYAPFTNRLSYIDDAAPAGNYDVDLDDQDADNYAYDEIGNLTRDEAEGVEQIEWTVYGKVKRITKSNGDGLVLKYSSSNHRIAKIFVPVGGTEKTIYYVRDATGRVLSIYIFETVEGISVLVQQEVPTMGRSRIGVYKPDVSSDVSDDVFERKLGEKVYELADHLANARVAVSDIKCSELNNAEPSDPQSFTADIIAYNNYFPFGMEMPDRGFGSSSYRYGFNGMEKDDEIKGSGNSYFADNRVMDPRLGRWISLDRVQRDNFSMYAMMSDNPVLRVDPKGNDDYDALGPIIVPYDAEGQDLLWIWPDGTVDLVHPDGTGIRISTPEDAIVIRHNYTAELQRRKRAAYTDSMLDLAEGISTVGVIVSGAMWGLTTFGARAIVLELGDELFSAATGSPVGIMPSPGDPVRVGRRLVQGGKVPELSKLGRPGRSRGVREVVGDTNDARNLFDTIRGNNPVTEVKPGVFVAEGKSGGNVTFREVSKSGPPTVDVHGVEDGVRKIKFVKE